jgi:hypothetical protein
MKRLVVLFCVAALLVLSLALPAAAANPLSKFCPEQGGTIEGKSCVVDTLICAGGTTQDGRYEREICEQNVYTWEKGQIVQQPDTYYVRLCKDLTTGGYVDLSEPQCQI